MFLVLAGVAIMLFCRQCSILSIESGSLVLSRRFFDMVNHDQLHRALFGVQFEPSISFQSNIFT